ncbi:MAG: M23 family metallopeptidase [Methylococcales bacterium]|jgi:murein DD-endopeptidase MepM/ murein hydrolase activator NlpD|nr:M23 family metallopeptidase [Methylococcales bacterium]
MFYVKKILLSSLLAIAVSQQAMSDQIELQWNGYAKQGGLLIGKTLPKTKIFINKKPISVSTQGDFLIGFGRDEKNSLKIQATFPNGGKYFQTIKVKKRKYKIQRINNLPKRKVTPNKKDLDRIYKEYALSRKARKINALRTDYKTGFIWPVKGRISGVYGSQRILNGKPKRPHFGVDVAVPTGTGVVAPADGIVTMTHSNMFFSGGTLILDHGQGLSSSFLHLSKIVVKKGDVIKQGMKIAEVGATGRVTGPHLDWRMNLFKRQIDPQLLVEPMK